MEDTQILQALADIGTSGILLYFVVTLWRDRKEKDTDVKELNEKVLEIVKENTKVQSELKGVIEANIKGIETLTGEIYDVLTKDGNSRNNKNI